MKNSFFVLVLIFLVGAYQLAAQTFTWNGSISSNWATSTNWTPNGIPGAGSTVLVNSDAIPNPCQLDANRTIAILTVSAGTLDLGNFLLTTSTRSTFTGGVVRNGSISAPSISAMTSTTFNGTISLTKTGATNNDMAGGNTFNGPVTITNSGTARIRLANTNGDTYNDDARFVNTSAQTLDVGFRGTNTFAGNVTVDNSNTGGITFGNINLASATSTIASGKALLTNGFTNGRLVVRRMTQNGTSPNGSFSPTTATFTSCTFGGNFTMNVTPSTLAIANCSFTATNVFTCESNISVTGANNFSTVSGTTSITRNGGTAGSTWTGGNNFGDFTLTNNSTFLIRLAGTNGDNFARTAQFVNTSSGGIQISYLGTNTFADNITLTNSGSGGIAFGTLTGTSSQSAGGLRNGGYSNGPLTINRFTQVSTTANERITPTSFSATNSTFNGDFAITTSTGAITLTTSSFLASNSFISGNSVSVVNANNFSTVSGTTAFTINGGANTTWTGGNTFGNASITTNSAGFLRLAGTNPDDFNGSATFIQNSTGALSPAYNGNNTFSGNISTTGTATAIAFGSGTGRGHHKRQWHPELIRGGCTDPGVYPDDVEYIRRR